MAPGQSSIENDASASSTAGEQPVTGGARSLSKADQLAQPTAAAGVSGIPLAAAAESGFAPTQEWEVQMRTLSFLTALLFLAGCGAFQLTASPEPGALEPMTASPEPGAPEPTPIPPPAAGERVEVDVKPGQTVCLDVPDLKDARVVVRDDGLLIVLPNGGEIFLANFRPDPESRLPAALCLADQTVVLVLAGGLGGITPAAGPGYPEDDPLAQPGDDANDDGDGGNDGGNDDGDDDGDDDGNDGGDDDGDDDDDDDDDDDG